MRFSFYIYFVGGVRRSFLFLVDKEKKNVGNTVRVDAYGNTSVRFEVETKCCWRRTRRFMWDHDGFTTRGFVISVFFSSVIVYAAPYFKMVRRRRLPYTPLIKVTYPPRPPSTHTRHRTHRRAHTHNGPNLQRRGSRGHYYPPV